MKSNIPLNRGYDLYYKLRMQDKITGGCKIKLQSKLNFTRN
ncbi:hypothetical protein XCR1_1080014 [Xenorhabdus cabanillasii JM26]|uniref:Uncharacterized protein n=1 Tax=Xenorhabdus cabanillasii JM26 TaxID=1427517 RepID=W1INN3_9GAMM|nr:hypothetical protein XCR1_1080014 [Xenorhabdus cabanillasii JM26]